VNKVRFPSIQSTDEMIKEAKQSGREEVLELLPKGLFIGDTPPQEGVPYQYLGCYILRWGKDSEPTVGFSRLSDNEAWQARCRDWGWEQ